MTALEIDNDAVQWVVDGIAVGAAPLDALSQRPLLLLLHGYGSFEGDLIGLAPELPAGFVFASPRAPLVAPPPVENGFSWFPIRFDASGAAIPAPRPSDFEGSDPHSAAISLLRWIDALDADVASAHGTGLREIAVMGFSQGGAMATSLLRLRPDRFACAVNCSGFVAPGRYANDAALAERRPPVFWGRDEADPIISAERILDTAEWLPRHSRLEARLYPGIAHAISRDELADIGAFLRQHVSDAETSRP